MNKHDIDDKILNMGLCTMDIENASELADSDPLAFAMIRRTGIGASEAAAILGVSPFKTLDELMAEKKSTEITEDELRVSSLVNVRKGRELEPLIRQKFNEYTRLTPEQQALKPCCQFRLVDTPCLTTNFDGMLDWGELIPVEFKFVSTYGEKYFDRTKTIKNLYDGVPIIAGGADVPDMVTASAKLCGIPVYYYTQLQHQMMFVNAPYCYLGVLFDKDWTFKLYKIFAHSAVQKAIKKAGSAAWQKHGLDIANA